MPKRIKSIWILLLVLASLPACQKPEPDILQVAWQRTYTGNQGAHCSDVLLTDDGGFYILGTTNAQHTPTQQRDIYLIRAAADGAVLWDKTYGTDFYAGCQAIVATLDGNLAIAAGTVRQGTTGVDLRLIMLEPDGTLIWPRTFDGPFDEVVRTLRQTADGGYAIALS